MKYFTMIRQKKKEIIFYFQNKRMLKKIKLFFLFLQEEIKTRKIKNQIVEQFILKIKIKRIHDIIASWKNFIQNSKGKNSYNKKLYLYYVFKKMGNAFWKLKQNCFMNKNNNGQLINLAISVYENRKSEFLKM